ncbi:hypothetical protein K469DRAFT_633284 [Zopfia rhizophila CBS 207.26]|uniref:Aminoglycoside phosphotransferase domain-containing protein n=1 Tax=Zopfia rhizophila CBS 207.26 TaxID=1314779 RepID=A0A6A6E344_9PEZI|nr:hypothetical protein K469DRAFT_633284 [Zopfia rhizophila CBS 207.26]
MPVSKEYSQDDAIAELFTQTCTTRSSCESKALELVGGTVVPVEVQGVCSYTVYAGPKLEYVVQFRLKSLKLDLKIATLAEQVYGSLAPSVKFHGALDENDNAEKEPLLVYVMERMMGITHLDFILAHGFPENSESNFASRRNLMTDIARFMALSWNAPQEVSSEYRESLCRKYISDLQLLLLSLPERFHPTIQRCLDQMDSVFSLPMVLLHRDFGTSNILVDESCHLTGVIDWAEAEICPFGQNLHSLEAFTGTVHLRNGWRRYEDYNNLQALFWNTFSDEIGRELSSETKKAIETSRIMALLLSRGFTKRFANLPPPTPICDNDVGRYNMLYLDGLLINTATKFLEL